MQVLIPFSNRWHCRICTAVFLRHKSQQFDVSDKNINDSEVKVLILQ